MSHFIPKTQCIPMKTYQKEDITALKTKEDLFAKACLDAKRSRDHKDKMEELGDKLHLGHS